LRIFPAFLVFLAGAVILSRAGFAWLDRRDVLQAVTYTFNYRGPTPNFSLRHLWSLAVEEQFYLIWPLAFASLAVANGRRALAAVLMVVPLLRVAIPMIVPGYIDYVPTAFESVCDALATGCLAALLLPQLRRSAWFQRIVFSRLFPLAAALVWMANRQGDHPKLFWLICIPMMNVLIALLMLRYVERPSLPFGRFLNTRPLVVVGTLSYSIYLWQQLFLIQFRAPASVLQTFPINVIAALACAAVSYRLVETPFLRVKSRIQARKAGPLRPA
jgi:peptidoglycan/LPS O-acetylase OafA/YrhL